MDIFQVNTFTVLSVTVRWDIRRECPLMKLVNLIIKQK